MKTLRQEVLELLTEKIESNYAFKRFEMIFCYETEYAEINTLIEILNDNNIKFKKEDFQIQKGFWIKENNKSSFEKSFNNSLVKYIQFIIFNDSTEDSDMIEEDLEVKLNEEFFFYHCEKHHITKNLVKYLKRNNLKIIKTENISMYNTKILAIIPKTEGAEDLYKLMQY